VNMLDYVYPSQISLVPFAFLYITASNHQFYDTPAYI